MRIRMPRFLHKLFGEETYLLALIFIFLAGLLSIIVLSMIGGSALRSVPIHLRLWVYFIAFDVFAGIVANFTRGTKAYYQKHPHLKRWFVPMHIYPIILVLLTSHDVIDGFYIYALILASSMLVQMIKTLHQQWLVAGLFVLLNILLYRIFFDNLPLYLHVIHTGIAMKLIGAFSINYPSPWFDTLKKT